jgi:hypothetical protein
VTAATPGQAAGNPPVLYARWIRVAVPDADDAGIARIWRSASEGDRRFWADLAEQEPQPAPGGDLLFQAFELLANSAPFEPNDRAEWERYRADWISKWHAVRDEKPQPAPASMAGMQWTVDKPQPAPELAAAMAGTRESIARQIEDLAANYPETVFPASSDSRDAVSGTAMRHAYQTAARMIRAANAGLEAS